LLKLREILHSQLARFSGDDVDVEDLYNILDFNRKANRKVVDVLRGASGTLDKAIQDSYLIWSVPLALVPPYKLRYIEFSFERALGSEAAKYITRGDQ